MSTYENPVYRGVYDASTKGDINITLADRDFNTVSISTNSGNLTGVIHAAGDYIVQNGSINVEIRSAIPVFAKTDRGSLTATDYDDQELSGRTYLDSELTGYQQFGSSKSEGINHSPCTDKRIILTAKTRGDITFKYLPATPKVKVS